MPTAATAISQSSQIWFVSGENIGVPLFAVGNASGARKFPPLRHCALTVGFS